MSRYTVSRHASTKRDAERIYGWMKDSGMWRPKITGERGRWQIMARSNSLQMAKFASVEAHFEQGKR